MKGDRHLHHFSVECYSHTRTNIYIYHCCYLMIFTATITLLKNDSPMNVSDPIILSVVSYISIGFSLPRSLISTFLSWIDHSHSSSDKLLKLFSDIWSKGFSIRANIHAAQRKKLICLFCKKSGKKPSLCSDQKRQKRHHFQWQPVGPIQGILYDLDGLLHCP